MKGRLSLLLMTICVFAKNATHLPGSCLYEGETLSVGQHTRGCLRITCYAEGDITILECPLNFCPEKRLIGYHETNFSKPYPECCARPISRWDEEDVRGHTTLNMKGGRNDI
ncbi:uncharacterized protein LOC114946544 [Nylanderia fulva]|uniref:uncharacterized protein LOC114946544 n=1 Tax=Nylanderia fulva TaxID=613905 RepID=UPI0010FBAF06|nr:uncharacterized protein LOC114946544 [Nylanderia fulva]